MPDLPATIGRYRVESQLGRGAMGVVYKGHDPEIDRPVAIKLVRMDLLETGRREDYLARFRREVQAAARCLHPNIVAIYDFGSHPSADGGDEPFFVMEFVDAKPLDESLPKDAGIDPLAAGGIVLQLLDALAGAHALGVTHRDIKPANLLISADGRLKVMDFGISRVATSHLTQAGAVMGTPRYMSPEQIRGEAVDARSDIFSAGAVLHELLTGRTPFTGRSFEEVMVKLLYEEAVLAPELAPAWRDVVAGAIAKAPEQRFETAQAMAVAVRAAMGRPAPAPAATIIYSQAPRADVDPRLNDTAMLGAIERRLAQYLGPIAGRMVRLAAKDSATAETMCDRLAGAIDNPTERERFLADVRPRLQQSGDTLGRSSPGVGSTLSEAEIEQVQRDLTHFLGPIAKLLVKRAATSATTTAALREAVAQHLEVPAERATFLSGGSMNGR
ncbi:MAG TPA: serine/threonine-protein kinase [Caulobacteraceae bacterium]|jgi:serine/threonine-protein kinase|nr:serine/threonine-protein kinase [Caulobacteraceae bacterium]